MSKGKFRIHRDFLDLSDVIFSILVTVIIPVENTELKRHRAQTNNLLN